MLNPIILETKNTSPKHAVIWLHGLGADAHDFESIVPALNLPEDLSIRFIFPNAPKRPVTVNGSMIMPAWYDVVSLENLENEDEQGIEESRALIETLINDQIRSGILPSNIMLVGFSQGGAMSLITGLQYPEKLGGISCLSGYLPMIEKSTESNTNLNKTIPVMMMHGKNDPVVPMALAQKTIDYLKEKRCNISTHFYNMAHELCPDQIIDIRNYFLTIFGK